MSPATLFTELNRLGHDNGIGRLDLVENRFVGMKSRGVYETPGGTILAVAHRAMESLTLDREAAHLKDSFIPKYAELVYYGFWFSPEREMLQAEIDLSQEHVEGTVRLKLYKGNVIVVGRKSPKSLYSDALVTFEDDRGAYDQKDAAGFIRLNALRLRTLAAGNATPNGRNVMSIAVFGSINMDVTAYMQRLPRPGETLQGKEYKLGLGGKGANQAVAARKLGSEVAFICRLGDDDFAKPAERELASYGVDLSLVARTSRGPRASPSSM